MNKRTIRLRIFTWVSIHTLFHFFLIAAALICFDLYEYYKNPDGVGEELEEIMVVMIVMAFLLPVGLSSAWSVSRRLLHPWKKLMLQAESISDGQLEERIDVKNPNDEIGRLATTLNLTFDRYQHLLDRMQRFNYDASHQLRNPLAAIRTNGEVCLKHERSSDDYRAVIGGMLEDAGRLQRTVDQLLLLARTSGDLDDCRKKISLRALANDVVEEGKAIGELRGITVQLETSSEDLNIEVIPDLLREALANLVDNALKYSPENASIKVALQSLDSGHVRIAVSDSGEGLTPDMKARIFKPFSRGKMAGRESIGLGLAIVADICRAHSARFGVDDNQSGGCCFWMEFPVS